MDISITRSYSISEKDSILVFIVLILGYVFVVFKGDKNKIQIAWFQLQEDNKLNR